MKKTLVLLFVLLLICDICSPVYGENAVKKLGRGIANVGSSPLSLLAGMGEVNDESGLIAGATWGVLKGTVDMAVRALAGVYEIATFPVPIPAGYEPIIDDPEFFLDRNKPYY